MKLTAKQKKQLSAWENVSEIYEIEESLPESEIVKRLIDEGLKVFTLQQNDENKFSKDMFEKVKEENPSMELTKTTWVDIVKFKKNVDLGKNDDKEIKRLQKKINKNIYKAALTTEQLNSILDGREQKLLIPNETSEIEENQFEIDDSNEEMSKDINEAADIKSRIDEDHKSKLKELRMAFAWVTELDQYLYKTFVEIEYYKNGNPHGGNKKPIMSKEVKKLKTLMTLMDKWGFGYMDNLLKRNGITMEYNESDHFAKDDYSENAEKWFEVEPKSPKEDMEEPTIKNWHVIVEYDGNVYLIDRISNEVMDVIDPKKIPIERDFVTDFKDFNINISFYTEVENPEKLKRINNFIEKFNPKN